MIYVTPDSEFSMMNFADSVKIYVKSTILLLKFDDQIPSIPKIKFQLLGSWRLHECISP